MTTALYNAGMRAAAAGHALTDCPHPTGSADAEEWIDGFEAITEISAALAEDRNRETAFNHARTTQDNQPQASDVKPWAADWPLLRRGSGK